MMKKYRLLSVLTLLLLFVSCSPVKRLDRFHKRHPNLFESVQDTVTIKDTIQTTVKGSRVDTIFDYTRLLDTVYIDNGISHTTIYQNNDSIFFHNRVDTIFIETPYEKQVPVNSYNIEKPEPTFWEEYPLVLILILFIIMFAITFFIKLLK